jgi:hypothetical protein
MIDTAITGRVVGQYDRYRPYSKANTGKNKLDHRTEKLRSTEEIFIFYYFL